MLSILERSASHHLSAEELHRILAESGDDIALATVYRVLSQFVEAGLVIRHNFEGGHSVFELESGDHHDHLVCVRCNRVEEFFDEMIEERQKQIAEKAGYQITDHSLNLYGICSSCLKAAEGS